MCATSVPGPLGIWVSELFWYSSLSTYMIVLEMAACPPPPLPPALFFTTVLPLREKFSALPGGTA